MTKFNSLLDPPVASEHDNEGALRGRLRFGQQGLRNQKPPHLHRVYFNLYFPVPRKVAKHPEGSELDPILVSLACHDCFIFVKI